MKARWKPTCSQSRAMKKEINRQVLEVNAKYADDIDAAILFTLHITAGYGKKRLRRFYDNFNKVLDELEKYYEMPNDSGWLAAHKLKEIGVDVAAWNREKDRKT